MLLTELTEKNNQLLIKADFSAYIDHLYKFGVHFENEFVQAAKNLEHWTFPEESNKKQRFFRAIDDYFRLKFKFLRSPSKQNLSTRLWNLKSFLIAWEDPELRQAQDKQLRQSIKLKADIDKPFRQTIHAALIAEVIRLQSEVSIFTEKEFPAINFDTELNSERLNAQLIQRLTDCISLLQSETPADIHQTYDKAAQAIARFKLTADKFLHRLSKYIIGVLAALACGLATGGFLFLLVSGFGAPLWLAALSGLLMFVASTYANFGLFSKHSSRFLRTLAKTGSITEFIDSDGKRQQLSLPIKCLLALGALLSVGVGLSSASLTILFGMKLIAMLFPALGVTLAGILISALVIGMTIGLSLIIFKAWVYLVNLIRTKFSSWEHFKEWLTTQISAIKQLTVTQLLGYLFQIAFMGFALFGLFFLCFAGIPSLVPALGQMGSWIVGLAAFLGDLPFTIITVSSFCHSLMQLFSRNDSNATSENEVDILADKPSLLSRIWHNILLIANAVGRSIQVFDGRLISAIAAVACFFSALAGTLIKADNREENSRNKADQANKKLLNQADAILNDGRITEPANSAPSNSERRNSNVSSASSYKPVFAAPGASISSSDTNTESDMSTAESSPLLRTR